MNPIHHSQMLIHMIFSTKQQAPTITDKIQPLLYDRISKILFDECYSPALIIGGGAEHLHILSAQSRDWPVDNIVLRVKERSKGFIGKWDPAFDWQEGYAAFSISRWEDELKKDHIARQKEIHANVSFQDEIRQLLASHNIEYNENDLWE